MMHSLHSRREFVAMPRISSLLGHVSEEVQFSKQEILWNTRLLALFLPSIPIGPSEINGRV